MSWGRCCGPRTRSARPTPTHRTTSRRGRWGSGSTLPTAGTIARTCRTVRITGPITGRTTGLMRRSTSTVAPVTRSATRLAGSSELSGGPSDQRGRWQDDTHAPARLRGGAADARDRDARSPAWPRSGGRRLRSTHAGHGARAHLPPGPEPGFAGEPDPDRRHGDPQPRPRTRLVGPHRDPRRLVAGLAPRHARVRTLARRR